MSSRTRQPENLILIADGIANALNSCSYAHADQGLYFPQMKIANMWRL